jgi:SAM-dependent methyltransferase
MTTLPSYAMSQTSFPAMYEQHLVGPLFRPWVAPMLEAAPLSAGDRVLDVACGTGVVARAAKERLGKAGRVVGVDVSAEMLAVARAAAPDIEWREGDAAALPLRDGEQFDVVACQQGLQFFRDKPAAVAQIRRALARGGRAAIAVWRSDDEIPFFRELRNVAERSLGAIEDQRYSFGDADQLEALLCDARLVNVRVQTISRTIVFEDSAPFVRMNAMALVGMSAAGKAMNAEERNRAVETIASDSAPVVAAYSNGQQLNFELRTNLATGRTEA